MMARFALATTIVGGTPAGVDELTDFEKLDDEFCEDGSPELDADELTDIGTGAHAFWMRGASRILEEARPLGRAAEARSRGWLRRLCSFPSE